MATAPNLITPNFRAIADFAQRWAAYREGPFARDCADDMYEQAKGLKRHFEGKRFADGIAVFAPSASDKARAQHYSDIAITLAGVIDHLDGEPHMAGYLDELDELLWPERDGDEPSVSHERPSAAVFGSYRA